MKMKGISEFCAFATEGKNRRTIALILGGALILALAQGTRGLTDGKKYITDSRGKVVGLSRNDGGKTASFPLNIKASSGDLETSRELVLTLKGDKVTINEKKDSRDPEEVLNDAIAGAVDKIENTDSATVKLPARLEDGTVLSWTKSDNNNSLPFVMLPLILILTMYMSSRNKVKAGLTANRDSIRRSLPAFNNQLLMLLNCGLIFNDAFIRIAEGYVKQGSRRDFFQERVLDIEKETEETNKSLIMVLNDHGNRIGIREFSRIVAIITDNQFKGVDLTGKLEAESSILWNQRKKLAEEKGKLAETRLTFPLAILLVVLIVITAAPAILQVKGG